MYETVGNESEAVVLSTVGDISVPPALAFEAFYENHRDDVGRCLAMTLGDAALGFEAADEAMARAYQRWDQIRSGPNPSGWVYRTGLNWARSWLRRRRRSTEKAPLLARPDSHSPYLVDTDLAEALDLLSDDHRAVVVLRYFYDWSVDQTAEALDISAGTVKSRLSRALDQLNKRLDDRSERGSER